MTEQDRCEQDDRRAPPDDPATTPVRVRDAARTRQLLLECALRRFAGEGYAATTVRHVADDAGVNLALIKRYFGSKEGLFEACLQASVDDLREEGRSTTAGGIASRMAHQALSAADPAGAAHRGAGAQALLLLLRTSGDEGVDALRRRVLHQHSDRLARTLRDPESLEGGEPTRAELLRAQVALATAVGVAVLCASPGLEPLRSTSPEELARELEDLLRAAAPPSAGDAHAPPG